MDYITILVSVLCSIVVAHLVSIYDTHRENKRRREAQYLINRINFR